MFIRNLNKFNSFDTVKIEDRIEYYELLLEGFIPLGEIDNIPVFKNTPVLGNFLKIIRKEE